MQKQNKKGFTLVEIVVAIAIIGVIASLTIPTFFANSNSRNNQYVAGLKKVYSNLTYATDQIKSNHNGTLIYLFNNGTDIMNQYCTYLKCTRTCAPNTAVSGGCYNAQSAIKTLNNLAFWDDPGANSSVGFVLGDGTLILTNATSADCTHDAYGLNTICGWLHADINGFKGPNIIGRDIFTFYILKNEILPVGFKEDLLDYNTYCNPASGDDHDGTACAGRVMRDGKMLY